MLGEPAIVEARELLEHQACQELGLGELAGAVDVAVRRHRLAGRFVRDSEDPARGFAGSHISYYVERSDQVRGFSTEQVGLDIPNLPNGIKVHHHITLEVQG
jgi:hypothetical protein